MNGTADLIIRGATVITPELAAAGSVVAVSGGRISYVGPEVGAPGAVATVDGSGGFLLPGFVDLHCHGGGGCDVTLGRWDREAKGFANAPEDLREGVRTAARTHLRGGTTALVAATTGAAEDELLAGLAAIGEVAESSGAGARVLGANLEYTALPDGTSWTPDTDMARFTDPEHLDFRRYDERPLDRMEEAL